MTTLAYLATTVTLPNDLTWPDEFTCRMVEQKTTYSVTGALLVESKAKQTGRTITLQSDGASAWLSRTNVAALYGFAGVAGAVMTLVLRAVTYSVVFDHANGAIDATPVVDYSDPDPADGYVVTLRFLTVPTP